LLNLLFAGNIEGLSLNAVPALSQSQKQDSVPAGYLARQWKYIFDTGKVQNPSVAAVASSSFAYLAWSVRKGTALSLLVPKNSVLIYSTAALLTIGMVPYTIIFMLPTNDRLTEKAKQHVTSKGAVATDDKEVIELLKKWSFLSGIRGLLPLMGGVVSLAAILA
jgi:hypothetical protein